MLWGCASTGNRPYIPLTGDPLIDGPRAIEEGPARDKVLWQYRTGLAAMRRAQYESARQYFDDALARLGNIFGPDESARKSRGYFAGEAKKTFIGEPYERVMAYYYRGILYWMDGEVDNARAAYRSAQIQDADTEDKAYASDYALLDYLDGYATVKLGGDGSEEYARALSHARLAKPPPYNVNANVLFFVHYGNGPSKLATGEYGQELRFRGGASMVRSARIIVGQTRLEAPPYDDLYYQATTRGGRVMDHVLANKAVFKSSTDTAGNAAILSGAVLAGNRRHNEVGLGLLAVGLLAKAVSASTVPDADTRTWDSLPLFLSFAAVELPPGQHTATVEFLDAGNNVLPNLTKTIVIDLPAGGQGKVVYVSDKSITPQTI